jgi:hypothetical protein
VSVDMNFSRIDSSSINYVSESESVYVDSSSKSYE